MTTQTDNRSYLGLDVVRLAAALMVCLYHLGFWWWRPEHGANSFEEPLAALAPFVSWGWVGVPIFFVISGFVIAFSAARKSPRQFIVGRVLRLYPAAWICATIALLVAPSGDILGKYFRSLLLWPVGPWISGVYWTLAIEIIFYTVVALSLVLFGSKYLRSVAFALGGYSAFFWLAKVANLITGGSFDGAFAAIEGERGYLLLAHDGCFFAFGMLLWSMTSDPPRRSSVVSALGLAGIGLVAIAWRSHSITPAMGGSAAHFLAAPLIWLLATMLIIATVVWNESLRRWVGTRSGLFRTMGLMTYPLYLLHPELGRWVMLLVQPLGAWLALCVGLATVVTVSWAVLPIEELIRGGLRRRIAPRVALDRAAMAAKAP